MLLKWKTCVSLCWIIRGLWKGDVFLLSWLKCSRPLVRFSLTQEKNKIRIFESQKSMGTNKIRINHGYIWKMKWKKGYQGQWHPHLNLTLGHIFGIKWLKCLSVCQDPCHCTQGTISMQACQQISMEANCICTTPNYLHRGGSFFGSVCLLVCFFVSMIT